MRYFLSILFFLFSFTAFAQYYNISKFTTKDGLAQNHCRTIAKDSRGNIWIGTYEGGLCRYDGQKIVTYTVREGLSSNFIYDILEDKNKNIWVATGNGLAQFNGQKFTNYLDSDTVHLKINALSRDKDGEIWFFQERKGLAYISSEGNITFVESQKINHLRVRSLFTDKENNIWIATQNSGVFIYKNGKIKELTTNNSNLSSNSIYKFLELASGEMLIATLKGISIYKNGEITTSNRFKILSEIPVYSIMEAQNKSLWFGTKNGSYHFKNEKANFLNGKDCTFLNEKNGASTDILNIVQDDELGVWFASRFGLFRLNNEMFKTYTQTHGLTDNMIWSMASTKSGKLWVCSEKGISVLKDGKTLPLRFPKELENSPSPVLIDKEDRVFIGANNSIVVFENGSFKNYEKENKTTKKEHYVTGIITKKGDILLGGINGISIFDGSVFKDFITLKELKGFSVNSLLEVGNELWIGTNGGGIFIHKKGFTLQQFSLQNGLPNEIINTLLSDKEGNIWIGTSGNGICKIPKGDITKPVVRFEDLELTSTNVYSLIIDNEENLWVGTDRGLNKVIVIQNDDLRVRNYTEPEGFPTPEVCHNAIQKDEKGHIWVGTVDGLVEVNPLKTIYDDTPPITYFTGVHLFFRDVFWGDDAEGIDSWTAMPKNLDLPHGKNHLTFHFVGVSLNMPQKVTYQWRLIGFEEDWSPKSVVGEIIYPNLSPGSYELQVRACNANGYCSDPILYDFSISKPFYQRRSSLFFTVMLILGFAYYLIRMRMLSLIKSQAKLQRKVRMRTSEIEHQKIEIEAQSEKLQSVLEKVDKQNKELVSIQLESINSMSYARKIQDVIIYADCDLTEFFEETFIWSMPRDIVSSDFYWVKDTPNYKYIILADCTGYGIPGALLSMVGFQFLSQIIRRKDIDPASILYKLHSKLLKTLKSAKDNNLNDGIDLSICRIDKRNDKLTYAGARRPLLYIQDEEQHFMKGNFCSTGIDFEGVTPEFTNHEIQLKNGDFIYLFSDGFANQFGGIANKKYKITAFRNFLHSIHKLVPQDQKNALRQEFKTWIKDSQQQDDILVIGFKYCCGEEESGIAE